MWTIRSAHAADHHDFTTIILNGLAVGARQLHAFTNRPLRYMDIIASIPSFQAWCASLSPSTSCRMVRGRCSLIEVVRDPSIFEGLLEEAGRRCRPGPFAYQAAKPLAAVTRVKVGPGA